VTPTDEQLRELAARLITVPGVIAVLLGGSRARGDHTPESDVDLGLYYQPPLDTAALGVLAREVSGPDARVSEPGAWGRWVDGGGWLTIFNTAVDWLYRDLGRVQAAWRDAQLGRYLFHPQVGHPLGVPDFAYVGEVALGVVLADPTGQLTELQQQSAVFPSQLSDALTAGLWEATFLVDVARKAVVRSDTLYVAGCLFRAVGLCAHALHGRAGRWLINEKGAIVSAARLDIAPNDFEHRAQSVLAHLGTSSTALATAIDAVAELVRDTDSACQLGRDGRPKNVSAHV
jgi:hypothetical protein